MSDKDYELRRQAKENLEKTIRDTGVSSEKAHKKAMDIAHQADSKNAENKNTNKKGG